MISTRRVLLSVAAALAAAAASAQPAASTVVPDAEIRKVLVERIDTQRQGVGMVVGVIDRAGRRVVSYGSLAKGDTRPVDGDTSSRSARSRRSSRAAAGRCRGAGEVALTDPVAKYLPRT